MIPGSAVVKIIRVKIRPKVVRKKYFILATFSGANFEVFLFFLNSLLVETFGLSVGFPRGQAKMNKVRKIVKNHDDESLITVITGLGCANHENSILGNREIFPVIKPTVNMKHEIVSNYMLVCQTYLRRFHEKS